MEICPQGYWLPTYWWPVCIVQWAPDVMAIWNCIAEEEGEPTAQQLMTTSPTASAPPKPSDPGSAAEPQEGILTQTS